MKKGLGIATLSLGALLVFSGCSKDVAVKEETKEESVVAAASITKDEAYDIFQAAQYRFLNNVDGVRNNLLVVDESEGTTKDHTSYYVDENGKEYVLKEIENGATYYEYALWYSKPSTAIDTSSDEIHKYIKRMNNGPVEITKEQIAYGNSVNYYAGGDVASIEKDDLLEYRVLENGNYQFAIKIEQGATGTDRYYCVYVIIEVTKDYKIVSVQTSSLEYYREYSESYSYGKYTKSTYKYGEANVSKINSMLAEANAA